MTRLAVLILADHEAGGDARGTSEHFGGRVRMRALTLKLPKSHIAAQIVVDQESIQVGNRILSNPEIRHMPAIIQFLGYNPLPAAEGWVRS